jgi:hypothetical protein
MGGGDMTRNEWSKLARLVRLANRKADGHEAIVLVMNLERRLRRWFQEDKPSFDPDDFTQECS